MTAFRTKNTYQYILLLLFFITGCQINKTNVPVRDLPEIKEKKELNILTLYSSSTYFLYRGEEVGYEYELARQFADSQGLKLKVTTAESVTKLVELLQQGVGDIIVYPMSITNQLREEVSFVGREIISHQVLVQRRSNDIKLLNNVTQLIGKDIYVEKDSKYDRRLKNLNEELGGGINIHYVNQDTLTVEDLIGMVGTGDIPYTLADNNIAQLNKAYYNNLNTQLEVSFAQRSSWAVRQNSPLLAKAINQWFADNHTTNEYKGIMKRYFENSRRPVAEKYHALKKGVISPFDNLFKKYAETAGVDWRFLAAIGYKESKFDTMAVSFAGALGLMQIMPATARNFGSNKKKMRNPDENIRIAAAIVQNIKGSIVSVQDEEEKLKYIIAAYNAGLGHVLDAMALTNKYGKESQKWENVAHYLVLKNKPEYFNDPVCKVGYFNGKHTVEYVDQVMSIYHEYKRNIKK